MTVRGMSVDGALLLWLGQSALSTLGVRIYAHGLPLKDFPPSRTPSVAVLVPVKGAGPCLPDFLNRLRHQDYPGYRIVAAVESRDDPAFSVLDAERARPGAPLEIAVAGLAQRGGQKVANLLAALDRLGAEDELVAFIDADTLPTEIWLARLVAVHVDAGMEVVTGYRWITPADGRLGSALLAAANASVATLPRRSSRLSMCWGGSLLLPKRTLDQIGIRTWWDGAVSDDFQMTAALAAAGIRPHATRQSLLLTPVSMGVAEAFAFGVRQYRLLRTHRPATWLMAVAFLVLPPACFLAILPALAAGDPVAWAGLVLIALLGEMRTRSRMRIQRALWGDAVAGDVPFRWQVDRWLRPAWWLLHAGCAAAAAASRTIRWAGVAYRIDGPRDVAVRREP